ncbi:MAG: hypothetical protein JWN98_1651 [Abditibacteriota bacterium]|nr:hypothetical protein [Abditibacteriota bacterium]
MTSHSTYIIAEAGVNHNGSLEMAQQLVEAAAAAGADAVKFQTFKAENLAGRDAPKAEYQNQTTDKTESQFEMLKKLELDENAHKVLWEQCRTRGIEFLSTPFDLDSLDLLARQLDLPRLKLSSGEITNAPLLLAAARTQKPIILSTGMSTLGEVEIALGVLAFGYTQPDAPPSLAAFEEAYCTDEGQNALHKNISLLHCTTEYPTPFEDVNLRAMDTLHSAFSLSVGFSDHTRGITIPIAAVARGASIIEKHFTLDRTLPGPDHIASLEPDELDAMVQAIRQVERALGSAIKSPAPSERKNKAIARKSLVAACSIRKGELFTVENLATRRPGSGLSPVHYWDWIGRVADRDYRADDLVGQ